MSSSGPGPTVRPSMSGSWGVKEAHAHAGVNVTARVCLHVLCVCVCVCIWSPGPGNWGFVGTRAWAGVRRGVCHIGVVWYMDLGMREGLGLDICTSNSPQRLASALYLRGERAGPLVLNKGLSMSCWCPCSW